MPAQFTVTLYTGYWWTIAAKITLPDGPIIYGTPAGLQVTNFAPPTMGRFQIPHRNAPRLWNRIRYLGREFAPRN